MGWKTNHTNTSPLDSRLLGTVVHSFTLPLWISQVSWISDPRTLRTWCGSVPLWCMFGVILFGLSVTWLCVFPPWFWHDNGVEAALWDDIWLIVSLLLWPPLFYLLTRLLLTPQQKNNNGILSASKIQCRDFWTDQKMYNRWLPCMEPPLPYGLPKQEGDQKTWKDSER